MFRSILPAAIVALAGLLPLQSAAQAGACRNTMDEENCVRVLACVGAQGVVFDGHAYGWEQGVVKGLLSSGVPCGGQWSANGPMGTGFAQMQCGDGVTGEVIYFKQDSLTGTAIGRGKTSRGEAIRIWSGRNVLEYLRREGGRERAILPCESGDIPVS